MHEFCPAPAARAEHPVLGRDSCTGAVIARPEARNPPRTRGARGAANATVRWRAAWAEHPVLGRDSCTGAVIARPDAPNPPRTRGGAGRGHRGRHDERLNEKGHIVPGLGDAGDRLYDTA